MTFQDLPKGWHSRPLTDTDLAPDVVDLVVRESDRATGCISLLLCDDTHRMVQPVTITDLDRDGPGDRRQLFDLVVGELAERLGGVVIAIGRPRGSVPDDEARAWHEAAIASCRDHAVPLLRTYLATAHGVVEMPRWDELDVAG
ncbi:MAG TPA: hypothetical protein H9805_08710 [Candidatus Janibacter merdipullorum]|nr:hypothetical protein [Candidatus Janibacter merdipullorum]